MKDSVMCIAVVEDSRGVVASAIHCSLHQLRDILIYSFNEAPIPQSYVKFLKEGEVIINRLQYIVNDAVREDYCPNLTYPFSELLNDESTHYKELLERTQSEMEEYKEGEQKCLDV